MALLDLFFPKFCVVCKKGGDYLCADCLTRLSFDTKRMCVICGKLSMDGLTHPVCKTNYGIDGVFCGIAYNKTMKKLIFRLKYKPFISDLVDLLANLFYESLIQQESFIRIQANPPAGGFICIPVPLSSKKLRTRGYNQSELIGKNLSRKFDWKFVDCLERVRDTKPQFGLTKKERIENIKGAFRLKANYELRIMNNATTFLVDDLLTTGITLREAASVLKRNGFKSVWGISLAGDKLIA